LSGDDTPSLGHDRTHANAMVRLKNVLKPCVRSNLQDSQFRRQYPARTLCRVGAQNPTCINNNKSNAQKIWPWQATSDMATQ